MARGSQAGHARERKVKRLLEAEGWLVFRAPASLGVADLVALKAGQTPLLIEVKSTAGGPYERFSPADRQELKAAAIKAGATPLLAYWPAHGKLRWIREHEWPS